MVRELDFPVEIQVCPTIRDPDGLAKSSRNVYLNVVERKAAPVLYRAIQAVETAYYDKGERNVDALRKVASKVLSKEPLVTPQYLSFATMLTGDEVDKMLPADTPVMFSLAVRLGTTRLIDNTILKPPQ